MASNPEALLQAAYEAGSDMVHNFLVMDIHISKYLFIYPFLLVQFVSQSFIQLDN